MVSIVWNRGGSSGVVGGNGFFAAVVDVEAGMFSGEEVGEAAGADVFALAQGGGIFRSGF
jgi:hypothetical protein